MPWPRAVLKGRTAAFWHSRAEGCGLFSGLFEKQISGAGQQADQRAQTKYPANSIN
jgi:hypothetical protein